MKVLVIGLGRFGLPLASTLEKRGWDVMGVDISEKAIERAKSILRSTTRIEAVDEATLRHLNRKNFDLAFVAIGNDFQSTVLAVAILKDLGVKEIVARANSPREARVLKAVGADRTIEIEAEMGERLGKSILSKGIVDFLPLQDDAALVEWKAPEKFWGRSLRDIDLRRTHGVSVIAVWEEDLKRWDFVPDPEDRVHQGDVLMIIGPQTNVEKLTGSE